MLQSVKRNLLAAFGHLLRPLVRIAVRNGVSFPEFSAVLQDAYVSVATMELEAAGREATVDAIAVMTDVSPADVRVALETPVATRVSEADIKTNAIARVLVGWHTDRDYVGPYGLVRDLEYSASGVRSNKDVTGFSDLVGKYCPGFPSGALLDEMTRTGCVKDLGNGFYRAMSRSYVPEQLSAESLRRFAQVVHNFIETLEVNLKRSVRGTGRIERTVFADYGLPRNELPAFDKYIRERGQLFADDIDNWLSDRSQEGLANTVQTGIGFYHYVVNKQDESDFGKALSMEGSKQG